MATKKIYLVDTENVGSTWKELLPAKANADQILLFFTENSPYVSYTDLQLILQYPNQFEMIRCNPGKNGLDFQLVSYLGYLLKTASKSNYIIVSNDCGFDAVVKFWQERGMSVIRSNVYHVLQPDAAAAQQPQASPAQAEAPKGKRGRYPYNGRKGNGSGGFHANKPIKGQVNGTTANDSLSSGGNTVNIGFASGASQAGDARQITGSQVQVPAGSSQAGNSTSGQQTTQVAGTANSSQTTNRQQAGQANGRLADNNHSTVVSFPENVGAGSRQLLGGNLDAGAPSPDPLPPHSPDADSFGTPIMSENKHTNDAPIGMSTAGALSTNGTDSSLDHPQAAFSQMGNPSAAGVLSADGTDSPLDHPQAAFSQTGNPSVDGAFSTDGMDSKPDHPQAAFSTTDNPLAAGAFSTDGMDSKPNHPQAAFPTTDNPLAAGAFSTDGMDSKPDYPQAAFSTTDNPLAAGVLSANNTDSQPDHPQTAFSQTGNPSVDGALSADGTDSKPDYPQAAFPTTDNSSADGALSADGMDSKLDSLTDTAQEAPKKVAKRGRPKGSRSQNKTADPEKQPTASKQSATAKKTTVVKQSTKTKRSAATKQTTPAKSTKTDSAVMEAPAEPFIEPENITLDFSNLTVSEKAALLRKYLPAEFSENQESLDIISDIMFGHDTTNHHQLHLAFVKNFGDEKGTLIYKAFRPHLAEFRA